MRSSATCNVSNRLQRCVAFLTAPASASIDLEREVAYLPWLAANLAADLRDPDELLALQASTDRRWMSKYGLSGDRLARVRRLVSDAIQAASVFDILRFIPHVMTRGVELMDALRDPPVTLWDFAGQLEFFPMHQFLLSSLNVVHLVVFDATYGLDASFERVSHWLSFVAASIDQRNDSVFGDAPHQRQATTVVMVATHTDSPHFQVKMSGSNHEAEGTNKGFPDTFSFSCLLTCLPVSKTEPVEPYSAVYGFSG